MMNLILGLLIWLLSMLALIAAAGVCLRKPRNNIPHDELERYRESNQ